jgi:hypothetical protein
MLRDSRGCVLPWCDRFRKRCGRRNAFESDAAQLVLDGIAARDRATARLCGLGRELDGGAFDESAWRKSLRGLSLDEIHAQLRAFEVRFDAKYPPAPVSRPERLPEDGEANRLDVARAIAAGG